MNQRLISKKNANRSALINQGGLSGNRDIIQYHLYDTIRFATTWTNPVEFFSVGIGQGQFGITKTLGDTNLQEGRKLPTGQEMTVEGIAIQLVQTRGSLDDTSVIAAQKLNAFYTILNWSILRVKFPSRDSEIELSLRAYLSLAPVVGVDAAAASQAVIFTRGEYLSNKVLKLDEPLILGSLDGTPVPFVVQLVPDLTRAEVVNALTVLAGSAATESDFMSITLLGGLQRTK